MIEYLEGPYIIAIGTVIGALVVIFLFTFVSNGPEEEGKSGKKPQRFMLPCMINPTTLDSEDEDEQVPKEDLSKVKGEVIIEKDGNANQDDGQVNLEQKRSKDLDIFKISDNASEKDSCIKVSQVLEAEHKIKSTLSAEELLNERQTQQQQLAAIFEIMQKQSEKFGDTSMNDINEQMKLYR